MGNIYVRIIQGMRCQLPIDFGALNAAQRHNRLTNSELFRPNQMNIRLEDD